MRSSLDSCINDIEENADELEVKSSSETADDHGELTTSRRRQMGFFQVVSTLQTVACALPETVLAITSGSLSQYAADQTADGETRSNVAHIGAAINLAIIFKMACILVNQQIRHRQTLSRDTQCLDMVALIIAAALFVTVSLSLDNSHDILINCLSVGTFSVFAHVCKHVGERQIARAQEQQEQQEDQSEQERLPISNLINRY
jgi:Ca2+/Na+ antiporter